MEKCRDVTQGYTTQQECDKWPQQICQLEKKVVKKYSPETEVKLFAYNFSPYWDHRPAQPKILHIFIVLYITLVQKASPSIVWTRCMPYHCWSKRMPKRNENDCTGSTKRAMFSPCTAFLWIWNKIGAGVRWFKKSMIN